MSHMTFRAFERNTLYGGDTQRKLQAGVTIHRKRKTFMPCIP